MRDKSAEPESAVVAIELLGPPAFGSVGGLIQKMREDVSRGSLSEHHDYGILRLKERQEHLLLPHSLASEGSL